MRACISLGSRDFDQKIFKEHDFFEFRLDLADLSDLVPLAKESIATNHTNPKALESINSTYVDLDHKAPSIRTNAKIIRSLHDYKKTPSKDELLEFIHQKDDSLIKKIACKVNSPNCFEILYSLFEERDNLVVVPMGDPNYRLTKTRSLWTYVRYGPGTAPGQPQYDEYLRCMA